MEREGLNMRDVNDEMFAREISPSDMWKLMVNATYEQGDNNVGDTSVGTGPWLAQLCPAASRSFPSSPGCHRRTTPAKGRIRGIGALPDLADNIVKRLSTNIGQ
jgi:hypothetical protein